MLTTPFLTDLDSRAAVKGSRDPLGIQQIWTRLGRHVVGNLTTVSNSVRDFTTLLLGYYFAGQLADELGLGSELATFLKWEQLAAYARATANADFSFRGTERVRKNLSEGSRVTLSEARAHQILGNQKIYGLWGLYTMPARASALVAGDPPRLTPAALEFVERLYIPILEQKTGKSVRRIRDALRSRSVRIDVNSSDRPIIEAVGIVLRRKLLPTAREFYRHHLVFGGPQDSTEGRQRQLAGLLEDTLGNEDFIWSPTWVGSLAKEARARGDDWHSLAYRLSRIRTSESVLGPVSMLFNHLLGLDGRNVDDVTRRLRDSWGKGLRTVDATAFAELRGEISAGDTTAGERWIGIANAVASGHYGKLIDLLIEQNKTVMDARGGASWIEKRNGKLHVRFRDEQGALPASDQISTKLRFPYFLDSLRAVTATVKEN